LRAALSQFNPVERKQEFGWDILSSWGAERSERGRGGNEREFLKTGRAPSREENLSLGPRGSRG